MSSLIESGVCPLASRYSLEALFFRFRISPRPITRSCSLGTPSIWMEPKEKLSKRTDPPCQRSSEAGRSGGASGRAPSHGLGGDGHLESTGRVEADLLGRGYLDRRPSLGIAPHPARALAHLPPPEPGDADLLARLQLLADQPEDQLERLVGGAEA